MNECQSIALCFDVHFSLTAITSLIQRMAPTNHSCQDLLENKEKQQPTVSISECMVEESL